MRAKLGRVEPVWTEDPNNPAFLSCTCYADTWYDREDGRYRSEYMMSETRYKIPADIAPDQQRQLERELLVELKSHLEVYGVDTSNFWEKAECADSKD